MYLIEKRGVSNSFHRDPQIKFRPRRDRRSSKNGVGNIGRRLFPSTFIGEPETGFSSCRGLFICGGVFHRKEEPCSAFFCFGGGKGEEVNEGILFRPVECLMGEQVNGKALR